MWSWRCQATAVTRAARGMWPVAEPRVSDGAKLRRQCCKQPGKHTPHPHRHWRRLQTARDARPAVNCPLHRQSSRRARLPQVTLPTVTSETSPQTSADVWRR